ncbi:hypothetical protein ACM45H_003359 [Vibrio parahaemolyticus]
MTWEFIERKEAFDYIGLNNKSVNEIEQFLHGRVRISAALFSNKKLYLSRQSLIMLASLNEYDHAQARSTHQVNTLHASVNGMLNDYEKAATLMGVHTQVAHTQRR